MKTSHRSPLLLFLLILNNFSLNAQQKKEYDLVSLFNQNKLVTYPHQETRILTDAQKPAITSKGIVWIKDVDFKNGTIDIDLRGKDVFLQSFLGVAFHGVDTITYDVIYFRPFNFRHADTARRKWSVQYMSMPSYDYSVLRKAHPLMYENSVNPVPKADEWFHATIVVKGETVAVYVNHAEKPSLSIKKLNERHDGKIGLWSDVLSGDFANLVIRNE